MCYNAAVLLHGMGFTVTCMDVNHLSSNETMCIKGSTFTGAKYKIFISFDGG
jgi:hypothetical protein